MAYPGRVPRNGPSSSQQAFPLHSFGQSVPAFSRTGAFSQQPQQQPFNTYAQTGPMPVRGQMPDQPRATAPATQREQDPIEITDDQKDEIFEAFKIFDLDRDNHLDFHETRIAFRALGFDLPKAEVSRLIVLHGKPKPHLVAPPTNPRRQPPQQPVYHAFQMLMPYEAFAQLAAQKIAERSPEVEIERAFDLFDLEHKGHISIDDLKRVAHELGENNLQEHEFQTMIEEFDYDDKGGITYEVFKSICMQ